MIAWFVEAMIASTLLMLVVMAIRKPVARLFGPQLAYALWMLPALRMILPPLPALMSEAAPLPLVTDALPLPIPSAADLAESFDRVSRSVAAPAPVDWTLPLAWVWLAGAFLTFALALFAHSRFLRAIRASGTKIGDVEGVPLWTSSAVEGPLAFGFVARGVAVPCDFLDRYSADERDFVLRHEAMHHRRRDIIVNLAALAVQSIHWFNPIAYWAHRAFRDDQELACDAAVLAHENAPGRQAYGWALVKSACGALPAAACAMDGKGKLKRRLIMMNRKTNSRRRALAGGVAIAAAIGTGLAFTASNSIAAPAPEAVETFVSSAAPAVQAIPAMPAMVTPAAHLSSRRVALAGLRVPGAPQPPAAPGVAAIPAVAPVPQVASVPRVAAVPSVPNAPSAPAAPQAPVAPEPPSIDDDPYAINATVRRAMSQARAEMGRARAEVARVNAERARCKVFYDNVPQCSGVDMAKINRDVAASLRGAIEQVRRDENLPEKMRRDIIASLERQRARFSRD